jgi:tryptophanyl-tRNA synthetase
MRILSGIQSSGRQHIGNYYGAIAQFIQLQDQGDALYFIADLHSLTSIQDPEKRRENILEIALTYLAFGLDPKRAILFRQSEVREHLELFWILGSVVPVSNLERAHSYKEKVANGLRPDFGLFAYPVLMAADILIYQSDVVPVGKDQKQHLEFARDWATKFNVAYVPGYDPSDPEGKSGGARGILKLPDAQIREETASLPGLDGRKMSKSYNNTIDIFADDAVVKKKIMGIKTDSTAVDAPKPLDNPLYALLKVMAPPAELERIDQSWRAGGKGYGDYKKLLLDLFHAEFDAARARRRELEKDVAEVDRILRDGADRARALAAPTIVAVKRAVGI